MKYFELVWWETERNSFNHNKDLVKIIDDIRRLKPISSIEIDIYFFLYSKLTLRISHDYIEVVGLEEITKFNDIEIKELLYTLCVISYDTPILMTLSLLNLI